MIDPDFVDLANRELDGVLSAAEQERLRQRVATDAEASKYFESLRATFAAIGSTADPDPPTQLESKILGAVPWRQERERKSTGARTGFRFWRSFTPKLRYALTFVFGVLFGFVFYMSIVYDADLSPNGVADSDFYGTMRYIDDTDGFEETRSIGVDLEKVTGTVRLYEAERVLLAEVSLDSANEIEWVLQYDESAWSFEGFRKSEGSSGDVYAASNRTRINQTGEARYLLFFSQKRHTSAPLHIQIFSADKLLLERSLAPSVAREQ